MNKPRPKWLLLFALVPLMVAFLMVDDEMPMLPWAHELLELVILVIVFGLMFLWMHSNRVALTNEERANIRWSDPYDSTELPPLQVERFQPHFQFTAGSPDRQDPESTPNQGRYN
jgi:hypothetical protein